MRYLNVAATSVPSREHQPAAEQVDHHALEPAPRKRGMLDQDDLNPILRHSALGTARPDVKAARKFSVCLRAAPTSARYRWKPLPGQTEAVPDVHRSPGQ